MTVGIIGLGRLGSALARGLSSAGATDLLGFNRTRVKAEEVKAGAPGLELCGSDAEVFSRSDVVFLWTKPADAAEALERNKDLIREHDPLIVSCTRGVPLSQYSGRWAETLPNVNMAAGRGVTLVRFAPTLGREDRGALAGILEKTGTVHELPVDDIPYYSALSSCGPALYATIMEIMADELSSRRGYDRELCRRLARETVAGTIALQDGDGADAAEVVRRVAHPGGPSEAGTAHLRSNLPALIRGMLEKMKKW